MSLVSPSQDNPLDKIVRDTNQTINKATKDIEQRRGRYVIVTHRGWLWDSFASGTTKRQIIDRALDELDQAYKKLEDEINQPHKFDNVEDYKKFKAQASQLSEKLHAAISRINKVAGSEQNAMSGTLSQKVNSLMVKLNTEEQPTITQSVIKLEEGLEKGTIDSRIRACSETLQAMKTNKVFIKQTNELVVASLLYDINNINRNMRNNKLAFEEIMQHRVRLKEVADQLPSEQQRAVGVALKEIDDHLLKTLAAEAKGAIAALHDNDSFSIVIGHINTRAALFKQIKEMNPALGQKLLRQFQDRATAISIARLEKERKEAEDELVKATRAGTVATRSLASYDENMQKLHAQLSIVAENLPERLRGSQHEYQDFFTQLAAYINDPRQKQSQDANTKLVASAQAVGVVLEEGATREQIANAVQKRIREMGRQIEAEREQLQQPLGLSDKEVQERVAAAMRKTAQTAAPEPKEGVDELTIHEARKEAELNDKKAQEGLKEIQSKESRRNTLLREKDAVDFVMQRYSNEALLSAKEKAEKNKMLDSVSNQRKKIHEELLPIENLLKAVSTLNSKENLLKNLSENQEVIRVLGRRSDDVDIFIRNLEGRLKDISPSQRPAVNLQLLNLKRLVSAEKLAALQARRTEFLREANLTRQKLASEEAKEKTELETFLRAELAAPSSGAQPLSAARAQLRDVAATVRKSEAERKDQLERLTQAEQTLQLLARTLSQYADFSADQQRQSGANQQEQQLRAKIERLDNAKALLEEEAGDNFKAHIERASAAAAAAA